MKVLLLDDDNFLRDMYTTKFINEGHEVHPVASGVDGLRALEEIKDIEVVLVDMIMPGMSGVEFITRATALPSSANTKFIVLSNQGQEADIAEAKKAGAIGYIIKAHSVPSEVVTKVLAYVTESPNT